MTTGIEEKQLGRLNDTKARGDLLRSQVEHAAHLLPAQGPIEVFVHHNTLHSFEEQHFHDAVIDGHFRYDAEPYLTEDAYHELLSNGRITLSELEKAVCASLVEDGESWIEGLGSRERIRLAMLQQTEHVHSLAEIRWAMREAESAGKYSTTLRTQRLWRLCIEAGSKFGEQCRRTKQTTPSLRPRNLLLRATGEDIDRYVHDVLIRFCAAFVDQGYSEWTLPNRDAGLWQSFLELYSQPSLAAEPWMRELVSELTLLRGTKTSPVDSIELSLSKLRIADTDRQEFIVQTLLSIRGWAGMIWQLESSVDWVVRTLPTDSLLEFLAVQLLLEVQVITHFGSKLFPTKPEIGDVLEGMATRSQPPMDTERPDSQVFAFLLFQLANKLDWKLEQLESLSDEEWTRLVVEIQTFDSLARRRVFHEAFELQYRSAALDAFAAHTRILNQSSRITNGDESVERVASARPSFQIVCCIDDREESFRRHLEEIAPNCETFGAAGFFAVAIYYRGASDGFYKPLCPGVITPDHYVQEDVGYTFEGVHRTRTQLRERLGRATHLFQTRSRTFLGGIVTSVVGSLAGVPLVARVLFPRLTSKIRQRFGSILRPPPVTKLQLERYADEPGPDNGHIGYSVKEMAGVVVRLLQDIGLTNPAAFSRLFVVCGHGSSSLNNPHESAYCCGACAGKRGGPNARAFAEMANDWRVRSLVAEAGIEIPNDTVFVGSYHNTCDDSVVFFDLDRLPSSHREDFEATRHYIEEGRRRNAHERCRRFNNAPLSNSPEESLQHVEARAQDISQARPEYNHATNAMCVVGRRAWNRGLFMDRRAFLTSYDPTQDDDDSSILCRILAAAIPVCAGINLEYYFSCVDPVVYGSGSKLPHNVVSLLGVMEGTSSDLRTGLYQQMVEIHEPLRLLCLIETTRESMLSIMDRHEAIGRLCRGGWVHLAVIDPATSAIHVFNGKDFEPHEPSRRELQSKQSSLECYYGSRDHLPFFSIAESEAI